MDVANDAHRTHAGNGPRRVKPGAVQAHGQGIAHLLNACLLLRTELAQAAHHLVLLREDSRAQGLTLGARHVGQGR